MTPVLLQIYDYAQMFDSINLKKAICDVFDAGLDDDMLGLIYEANKEVNMAVNTPSGLSERQIILNSVLQGDTFGSILASVQVDTIGKDCEESDYGYHYKDSLKVSLLGLVDDMIGVTEVGFKAQQMNALINIKITKSRRKLRHSRSFLLVLTSLFAEIVSGQSEQHLAWPPVYTLFFVCLVLVVVHGSAKS